MSEPQPYPYVTHLDIKYPALEIADVPSLVKACKDRCYNQTLCKVNDSVVRLGVMQGEYHWHKHDADDEFFFVLEGAISYRPQRSLGRTAPTGGDSWFRRASHIAPGLQNGPSF